MVESDYIGIRGWAAVVKSITPEITKGEVKYIVGDMSLLPIHEERDVKIAGKEMCLDVFFHCYTGDVAAKFYKEIQINDSLIVSGDLSHRSWDMNATYSNTNFWLDKFIIDESKGKVSSLSSKLYTSDMVEFQSAANSRYSNTCCFCQGKMVSVPAEYSSRMYCVKCDD